MTCETHRDGATGWTEGAWRRAALRRFVAGLAIGLVIWPAVAGAQPRVGSGQEAAIRRIVETFAKSAVDEGLAVGASVGITYRGRHYMFGYGVADASRGTPAIPATIYEVGSVTKIFTTALLGQNVVADINELSQPLADFETQLGPLSSSTRTITGHLYSDISTGLIGLLLGAPRNVPLDNGALDGWLSLLQTRILHPLRLVETFLFPNEATPRQTARLASGYAQALAAATVSSHAVTAIEVKARGQGDASVPAVTIEGGGGSGAQGTAKINDKGEVTAITVDAMGQDYEAPPGTGYADSDVVTVQVLGGLRGPEARAATLGQATIANGSVVFVKVLDGGHGYVDPIRVLVRLPTPATNAIPIWAAAGALKSSARDPVKLADVALGRLGRGHSFDTLWLWSGFQVAMQPYACQKADCVNQSGLAWEITAADNGIPPIISKNGGINGFSSEIRLVPTRDLGVVVLVNSRQKYEEGTKPDATAAFISDNILYAILEMRH